MIAKIDGEISIILLSLSALMLIFSIRPWGTRVAKIGMGFEPLG
jgi:hypothetical protein